MGIKRAITGKFSAIPVQQDFCEKERNRRILVKKAKYARFWIKRAKEGNLVLKLNEIREMKCNFPERYRQRFNYQG